MLINLFGEYKNKLRNFAVLVSCHWRLATISTRSFFSLLRFLFIVIQEIRNLNRHENVTETTTAESYK